MWGNRRGIDPLNIVPLGIANELPKHDEKYERHRLLRALPSTEWSVDEKAGIMVKEYRISVDGTMREDVNTMCNLSQGIRKKGRAEGRAENEIEFIVNTYENDFTLEQIAVVLKKSVKELKLSAEKAVSTGITE